MDAQPRQADGIDKVRRRWDHLRIARERIEHERRQREELADLYDDEDPGPGHLITLD